MELPNLGALGGSALRTASADAEATDTAFDDRLARRLLVDNRQLNYYTPDYNEQQTEREDNEVGIETWYLNLGGAAGERRSINDALAGALGLDHTHEHHWWNEPARSEHDNLYERFPRAMMVAFLRGWAPGWAPEGAGAAPGDTPPSKRATAPTYLIEYLTTPFDPDRHLTQMAQALGLSWVEATNALNAYESDDASVREARFASRPVYEVLDNLVRAAIIKRVDMARWKGDPLTDEQKKYVRVSSMHVGDRSEYGILLNWEVSADLFFAPGSFEPQVGRLDSQPNRLPVQLFEPILANVLWLARNSPKEWGAEVLVRDAMNLDGPGAFHASRKFLINVAGAQPDNETFPDRSVSVVPVEYTTERAQPGAVPFEFNQVFSGGPAFGDGNRPYKRGPQGRVERLTEIRQAGAAY